MFLRKTNFFLYSIGVLLLICKLATAAPREFPKYQINDPEAICNDGTPAVYYFRPSKFGGPQATWHVQLQGGLSNFLDFKKNFKSLLKNSSKRILVS